MARAVLGFFFMLMLIPQVLLAQLYTEQEITFMSGENELSGTLVMPNDAGLGKSRF